MLNVKLDLELFELGEKDSSLFRVSNKENDGTKRSAAVKTQKAPVQRASSLPPAMPAATGTKAIATKKSATSKKPAAAKKPAAKKSSRAALFGGGGPSGPMFSGGPSGPMFGGGGPSGPMYGFH